MTRQAIRQRALAELGLCVSCGKRPVHPESKSRCQHCLTKRRVAIRAKLGLLPGWRSGKGRPAFTRATELLTTYELSTKAA